MDSREKGSQGEKSEDGLEGGGSAFSFKLNINLHRPQAWGKLLISFALSAQGLAVRSAYKSE